MKQELHVVLGGAGAVGQAVIKELQVRGLSLRVVERNKEVKGVDWMKADLLVPEETVNAVKGATHVYVCIGLPYSNSVWTNDWPIVTQNIIQACEREQAKLIFLDNVYMYGPTPLRVPFDEQHAQVPQTPKGVVRKQVADMLLAAHNKNQVQVVIGRSADFYGPLANNSALYIQFIENVLKGKAPSFMGKRGIPHTYAFTTDLGRALVTLALDPTSYGDVWHLPVGKPITTDELNDIINQLQGTTHKVSYLPRPLLGVLQWFVPIIKEAKQMLYMFDEPYVMNDQKFRTRYPEFVVTDYRDGLRLMIESFKAS